MGGGIIGLATARALSLAGLRICLLERAAGPGAESSGAAAGILSPLYPWEAPGPVQVLAAESHRHYARWIAELEAATGIATGWGRPGLLSFDVDDLDGAMAWARQAGTSLEIMDADGIAARVPIVAPAASALWLAEVTCVDPAALTRALAADLTARGMELRWNTGVTRVMTDGARAVGVTTESGEDLRADAVVIAAGAWSSALLVPFGDNDPVRPVRGQALELQLPEGSLEVILMSGHRYLLPRPGGRVVVGSTVEEAGFDRTTTADGGHGLREFAAGLLPACAEARLLRHWAGLRPASASGLPRIGPAPGVGGLWLNTGHFRNGITLAPGSAARLAALMAD